MTSPPALLGQLLGAWTLERDIEGENARMSGTATFVPEPDGSVLYHEQGELVLGSDQRIAAFRRYRFWSSPDGMLIDFADGPDTGRRFVDLRFRAHGADVQVGRDVHLCGADQYDVTYSLVMPARFETDIVVTGPRKRYRAITRFVRARPSAA